MKYDYEKALGDALACIEKRISIAVTHHVNNIPYEMENYLWERAMWRKMRLF